MANEMTFDFSGAPPAQGKAGGDRIAPGTYLLGVASLDKTPAKSGRPMVTATLAVQNEGLAIGKKLVERFAFPKPDSDDSVYGLQRWHAFLVACGMKERKGKLTLDLDTIVGKEIVAEVDDEVVPANDGYPETIRSRPLAFYRKGGPEAANIGQVTAVPTAAAAEATAVPAPAAAPAVAEPVVAEEAPAAADDPDDLFADLE